MHYEVEQKYPVADLAAVRQRLLALGANSTGVIEQADCYYRHPVRDFAKTDEAFRIRRAGERNFMTYKGPKLDATTKSRTEEEVRLADGEAARAACDEIMRYLGFEPVALVAKRRETLRLHTGDADVEAALDTVAEVGDFVELEISVDVSDDDTQRVDAARQALAALAQQLGLPASERRSYLELLLASRAT